MKWCFWLSILCCLMNMDDVFLRERKGGFVGMEGGALEKERKKEC